MKILKLRNVKTPERGTPLSAGLDFFVPDDVPWERMELHPGASANIPSGIKVKVPHGFVMIAFNKSGQATKKNLQVGACVVDEDYQGEVHLHVRNVGSETVIIKRSEKLVQFVLIPTIYAPVLEVVDEAHLYDGVSERGTGAFGSTNRW